MKRPQYTATLLALLIFASGLAGGALLHRLLTSHPVNAAEDWRSRYVSGLQKKLQLSESQVSQIEDILDSTRQKVRAVKERDRPEMMAIKQDQMARIGAILSGPQRVQYEALAKEQEAKAREQEARDKKAEELRIQDRQRAKSAAH